MVKSLLARGVFVFACMALALGSVVSADELSEDLEGYTVGSINGQGGWVSTGAIDQAIVDNTGPVDYDYPSFGDQSLRMSNSVTSSGFFDQPFTPSLDDEAGETSAANAGVSGGDRQACFQAEWDFASTTPTAEQPGLFMTVSPDRGDGARMAWVRMYDTPSGFSVDVSDYYRAIDDFTYTNIASNLSRSVPHRIKLVILFVDGPTDENAPENDIVRFYVDGVLKHEGTSWENYFRDWEGGETITADQLIFRAGGSSFPAEPSLSGKGFLFDNIELYSGPTPENMNGDCFATNQDDDDDDDGGGHHTPPPEQPAATNTYPEGDVNQGTGGAVTASGNASTLYTTLVVNGAGNLAAVGDPNLISMGVVQAVNVFQFLPGGQMATSFEPPVTVCLRGAGTLYFRPAADQTGAYTPIGGSSLPGYVCTTLSQPGLLVLVGVGATAPAASAPASNGASTPLSDCQVTTDFLLRLRADANTSSTILDRLPMGTTLDATEMVNGWYRVVYGDQQGWVSGDYVSTSGNCG